MHQLALQPTPCDSGEQQQAAVQSRGTSGRGPACSPTFRHPFASRPCALLTVRTGGQTPSRGRQLGDSPVRRVPSPGPETSQAGRESAQRVFHMLNPGQSTGQSTGQSVERNAYGDIRTGALNNLNNVAHAVSPGWYHLLCCWLPSDWHALGTASGVGGHSSRPSPTGGMCAKAYFPKGQLRYLLPCTVL